MLNRKETLEKFIKNYLTPSSPRKIGYGPGFSPFKTSFAASGFVTSSPRTCVGTAKYKLKMSLTQKRVNFFYQRKGVKAGSKKSRISSPYCVLGGATAGFRETNRASELLNRVTVLSSAHPLEEILVLVALSEVNVIYGNYSAVFPTGLELAPGYEMDLHTAQPITAAQV